MSSNPNPRRDEKPFPIWKLLAAAGGLYFAYSLGYSQGQDEAWPDAAYTAAFDDSVEMPADEAMALAPPPIEITPSPVAMDASGYSTEPSPSPQDYSEPWSSWQAADAGRSEPDPATAAAEVAAADERAASYAQTPAGFASIPQPPAPYVPQVGCAENGSCYGDISAATGRPKTVSVRGYYRSDGTYVRGHYRSH